MNNYYRIIGAIDGNTEVLFGSFAKADCTYELDAERGTWKAEGYKGLKIITVQVADTPDKEVYKDDLITAHALFMDQAPSFNFELSESALLKKALEVGYITAIDGENDLYLINREYDA